MSPDWRALDPTILGPALAAGLLVLSIHVPLGREVLRRGIIFIDLAVAQIAGLGMLVAQLALPAGGDWVTQAAAGGAALGGALFLGWLDRRWPETQEALIGVAFILAATAGLLVIAHDNHGGEHIKDLLSGQILWVTWPQLGPIALLYAVLLGLWFAFPGLRRGLGFYVLFALAITASVQVVGVYLVFASLILPALAARGQGPVRGLIGGWLTGLGGYVVGLCASALFDLPAGPAVVWGIALGSLVSGTLRRRATVPLGAALTSGER